MATWRLTPHALVPQNAGFVLGHADGLIQWLDMVEGPTPAILVGGAIANVASVLTALQGMTNSSFAITINGTAQDVGPLDTTGVSDMPAAAALFADEMEAATCEWRTDRFLIQTDARGVGATLSYASAAASGTNVSSIFRITATTADALEQGAA